jgi:integrase
MSGRNSNTPKRAIAVRGSRVLSDSRTKLRSVRSGTKHWQPPEGLSPEEVRAIIAAAATERDRLLLRVLWATGARISEVLALRPRDVQRDSLVLPNRKNPNLTSKRVFLPGAELGLTGELLLWAKEQGVADDEPLFFSRKRGAAGARRPLSAARPGSSSSRPPSELTFASWRCVPPGMVRPARRRRCTRICSAMPACGRSCAARATCRSLSAKLAGPASSWPT